jgi:hypothetical protein
MAYKKLGPDVSQSPSAAVAGAGQYTADDHSFEGVVFQQDKPVLDWELNLVQEILGQAGTRLLALRTLPTCFLTGDFLEHPDPGGSYTFLSATAGNENKFQVKAANLNVNGWPVRFEYSGTTDPGENVIQLPAPPAGGIRTDLVILEVWRALVAPAPSTLNKSPTGQILRNGNAKAADQFPPGNVNLADDLLDPSYLQESAKRVQIQYRYRVIPGAALGTADIDGFGTILARSVPYQAGSDVDGEAPLFPLAYASQSSSQYGLWRAGAGNSADATALGTVDGFMYAVPICAVFRRNSTAFNRSGNFNGAGLIASGVSGRPDGLYADQIVADDVKDLRHGTAFDLQEVLEKNIQYLLDGTLATQHEVYADAAGSVGGTAFTARENVGHLSVKMGNPDGVRLDFSDRAVTESVVAKVVVVGATTTVTVSLNSLLLSWDSVAYDMKGAAPSGTSIVDVGQVRLVKASTDEDALNPASSQWVSGISFAASPGPEIDSVTLTFNAAISSATVYVELFVDYPGAHGTPRNMASAYELWSPLPATIAPWIDTTAFSATSDVTRQKLSSTYWWANSANRELSLRLPAVSQTATYRAATTTTILIPERIVGTVTLDGGRTVTNVTRNTAYTTVTFTPSTSVGAAVQATYTPVRAAPVFAVSDSYNLFYRTCAIQSVSPPAGTQTLHLVPRAFSNFVHVITSGSGSPDASFPFSSPGVHIPIPTQPAASYPESRLDAANLIEIIGYGIDTGYVRLPALIPYAPNPSQMTLYRNALDGVTDGDGRFFWPKSHDGSVPTYSPVVSAQGLVQSQRHKVAYPVLCELKSDVAGLGMKGTYVLVVFSKWFEFDDDNNVSLGPTISDSGAAVFRIKGGLMAPRRSDQ